MKTAEPRRADAAGPSGRRAQPVRQTRTNPPRTTSAPSRAVGGRESLGGGRSHDQPIDIFPAITHFTDAITALPKDLVRHFTLLKEVDAKIFAPEETLFQFVDAALKSSPPEPRSTRDGSSSVAPTSTPMSAQNSSTDHALSGHRAPGSLNESHASTVFDLSSVPRRNLFLHTAFKIQEMLVSLEEKNHVISTANDALSKQLARINDVWPHLENEFSDEAKWGSTSHWAYPENRINRANQAERSRRDGAAFITAAAQHLQVEEAAARSDARKQALMAKKGLKNQHHDSDADDHENKQKAEPPKKAQGASKARKGAEPATPVGLGITTSANGNPPSKRRKVENNNKTVNGGQPMERAMSSVYGGNAPKPRAASPRATPAPEPTKKRKALPTANGISKKSKTAVAATVAATVAPLIPSPTPQPHQGDKPAGRGSPAPPAAVPRPASSRARQNSIQSSAENGRPRPASSASSRPNGVAVVPPEVPIIPNGPRASAEPKTLKESTTVIKTEPSKEETNPHPPNAVNGVNKKENPPKTDDAEPIEPTHHQAQTTTTTTTVVTTKSGRASKPSTPAIGSFPDSTPRSRAARNVTTTTTTTATTTTAKRSHKKGASQHAIPTRIVDEDTNSSGHGDDEGDVDADEPLYCYCNGVSYGEMVACDADDCEREWFHLDCVGLKAAPPSNMKWYCDNCKDRIKTGKKVNGR